MPSYSGVFTLQAQMQAIAAGTWTGIPLVIGQAYQGGFYAGQFSTAGNGIADYNLVVGSVSTAQFTGQWKNATTATAGADSVTNGIQNTADMVADGNATVYPCAHFCNNLVTGGYSDWYMPAKNELEICYFNLKPTTSINNTGSGINLNAVPSRASTYTSGNPAQTSATDFKNTGAEDFGTINAYWASTEATATYANKQTFGTGAQNTAGYLKTYSYPVRAIRRVAV
jgi:hypothetical protein